MRLVCAGYCVGCTLRAVDSPGAVAPRVGLFLRATRHSAILSIIRTRWRGGLLSSEINPKLSLMVTAYTPMLGAIPATHNKEPCSNGLVLLGRQVSNLFFRGCGGRTCSLAKLVPSV